MPPFDRPPSRPDAQLNVLGEPLQVCSMAPLTGFYRSGCCETGPDDTGRHVVCALMTADFLEFSRERGNDLVTPRNEFGFPGLRPGDRWCLCALRWLEAAAHDRAPPVILAATHVAALQVIEQRLLFAHALEDGPRQ